MMQLTPGGWPIWSVAPGRAGRRFSLLVVTRRDQVRGGPRFPASFGSIWGGVRPARLIAGAETRCGRPGAQAIPEALSGLYPGVRNSSWSWRRRMPVLLPSMTGYARASDRRAISGKLLS